LKLWTENPEIPAYAGCWSACSTQSVNYTCEKEYVTFLTSFPAPLVIVFPTQIMTAWNKLFLLYFFKNNVGWHTISITVYSI